MLLCVLERFWTLRAESQGNGSSAAGLWEQKVLHSDVTNLMSKVDVYSWPQTFGSVLQDVPHLSGYYESELYYGFEG